MIFNRAINILFAVILGGTLQAEVYMTEPKIEEIKTLRTIVDGDFERLPVIDLQGNSKIEISFDYLTDEKPWLSYRVVHCNAQWEADDLSELDYMEGVMPIHLHNPQPSFNTITTNYYHYSVTFPNEEVKLLVSGNYAVIFTDDDTSDETVAVARFSVSEQEAFVKGSVSGNTDIDILKTHQQLSMAVNWNEKKLPYLNPSEELKIVVRQNRREDTRREVKKPLRLENGTAIYEHNSELIFDGCNTWRQFESIDERYPGVNIDHQRFTQSGYDCWLVTDQSRAHREFLTQPDVHGRYKVYALRMEDPDTEGEYCWMQFSLRAAPALDETGIYLMGDFTYGQRTEEFRMNYDPVQSLFVKDVYLKQGAYNYLYSTDAVEGNHYETPNEYDVMIYYRPFGSRYDRLIGTGIIE